MRTLLFASLCLTVSLPAFAADPSVVYLVRHAEKASDSKDPELTEAGVKRADALAALLEAVPLTDVFSTDYKRTRATATPTAIGHKLDVQLYNPGAPESMLAEVRKPGAHLVVGHSNTTPGLVAALGAVDGKDIPDLEYDRLYVVFVDEDGNATSQLLRYGAKAH